MYSLKAMASSRTFSGLAAGMGILALTAAAACSNDFQSPYIPRERFSAAYAQALCSSLQHCCSQNQVPYDDASCTAGWKGVVDGILADPVLAGNYSEQQATDCVNQVKSAATTTCDPLPGSISAARDACQLVFIGRKRLGELCTSPLECAPVPDGIITCQGFPIPNPDRGVLPLNRKPDVSRQPGASELRLAVIPSQRTCISYPSPGSGSSCTTPELRSYCELDPSSWCDPTDQFCKARGELGGNCTSNDSCKAGLFCPKEVCSPGQATGSPCTTSTDCDGFLYCAGTCVDRKRPGEGCAKDEECNVGVCDLQTNRCLANSIATSEACNGTDPTTIARR